MPENQNLAQVNLTQSQIITVNPHADLIAEINQLKTSLIQDLSSLTQKHQLLLEQLSQIKKQQKKLHKQKTLLDNQQPSPPNQPPYNQTPTLHQDPSTIKSNQVKQSSTLITQKQKQLRTLELRLQLLSLGRILGVISPSRLEQLQRIFNHYCSYIFKSGRHVTFDRIEYEKSHLIMERFFAFVHDFHINRFHDPHKGDKELVPKHELILIFKKSSSNSRNLELTEFIACLERFAVLRYDYEETFEERRQKEQLERKRIKELNLRREKERQRRKKQKDEYEERIKQQELRKAQEEQEQRKKQLQISQQGEVEGEEPKEESKEQRKQRKKREKEKKKKKKQVKGQNQSETHELAKSQQSNPENNNDEMLNELMQKDSSIDNPNEEFSHLKKYKKNSKTNILSGNSPHSQKTKLEKLLALSSEEKVELLYRNLEVDNQKSVEAKLREYEKPLFKQLASDRKSSIMLNSSSLSKIKQTDHNHQIKLNQLKNQLEDKKKLQQKMNISRSITDEKYSLKKKEDYEKYLTKSIATNSNDLDALEQRKQQNKKKQEPIQLSLNLLNQSSEGELNSLKLGNNLRRYFHPQEDDTVYLKEYGGLQKIRSSNSSFIERTPRYSVDIKKRASEVEQEEKKKEEQKLERFALQMYKNQHYMKRFLERKF